MRNYEGRLRRFENTSRGNFLYRKAWGLKSEVFGVAIADKSTNEGGENE
jgi:hypothetical protein